MNQNSSKLSKIILCILLGIILISGCASNEQAKDPVEVEPSELVEEKSQIELLAGEYDHLQWYLDNPYSKIVDGVTYDIQALKEEYGDLYRFVEPLTKEDIEYRFQYLAEFFQIQVLDGDFEMYSGGISSMSNDSLNEYLRMKVSMYENMATTNNEKLKKYNSYYSYLEKSGKYYTVEGPIFGDLNEMSELINIVDTISFDNKDWYVRNYMVEVDMLLKILEKNNETPRFNFKIGQRIKK